MGAPDPSVAVVDFSFDFQLRIRKYYGLNVSIKFNMVAGICFTLLYGKHEDFLSLRSKRKYSY